MEHVRVAIPQTLGGGEMMALRLQDMPAMHVMSFLSLPTGHKELMSFRMLQLAVGPEFSGVVQSMTYGELEATVADWFVASVESIGEALDWSEIFE